MANIAVGTSISAGSGASSPSARYIDRLGGAMGVTFTNISVPSSMVPDRMMGLYSLAVPAGSQSILEMGANEFFHWGADALKQGYFKDGLRAYALWLSASVQRVNPANGWTLSGAWTNTQITTDYGTSELGAKATKSFSGDKIALCFLRHHTNDTIVSVKVDGVERMQFASDCDVRTYLGMDYGSAAFIIDGCGAGAHVVEVEVIHVGVGGKFFFQWSSDLAPNAQVAVLNIAHHPTTFSAPTNAVTLASYNAIIAALVTELHGYGLQVGLCDMKSILGASDFADEIHWNDSGHYKAGTPTYNAFNVSLPTAPVTYTEAKTYEGSDGFFYIGDDENRKKLLTA